MPNPDSSVHEPPATAVLHLFHGTDMVSAMDLLNNGLNRMKAASFNGGGKFWATAVPDDADLFAQANPAGGPPARFEFALPLDLLQSFIHAKPPLAYQHSASVIEFLPTSFTALNAALIGKNVHVFG